MDFVAPLCCTTLLHHFVAPLCCTTLLHHIVAPHCCTALLHHIVAPHCCTTLLHHFVVKNTENGSLVGTSVARNALSAMNHSDFSRRRVLSGVQRTGFQQENHFCDGRDFAFRKFQGIFSVRIWVTRARFARTCNRKRMDPL